MKIEIWSDFACPFCYLGKRRLELALEDYEKKDDVEINFRSFELDTAAKKKYDVSLHELIAGKYGISLEEAKASNSQIISQAKEVGLKYNFEDIIPANTFDAHRLAQYAKVKGKGEEITERIFKAYFEESLNISDHQILSGLAAEVGLSKEEALEVLASDRYTEEVRQDQKSAARYAVRGVPYFLIDDKYAVSGAQPTETFLQVLRKLG
ncbi:MAG: Protein-disulfide isomerase DsbC/DsbG [Anaerocolumna sp.]|jgi:predicted DsbA family dithiol-disulfide isomerase|nr:Protein-disulfide isomerase DsbC/DsbG [Anaerocolumna sp.]